MALLQDIIVNIRNMRAEMKVDAKKKIPVQFHGLDEAAAFGFIQHTAMSRRTRMSEVAREVIEGELAPE